MKLKSNLFWIITIMTAAIAGCLTIDSVTQPDEVTKGERFQALIEFTAAEDPLAESSTRFGAIKVPVGFEVEEVTYNGSALRENEDFEAQITTNYPPEQGYYWWVGTTDDNESEGNFTAVVEMRSGNTAGDYEIDYRAGFRDPTATVYYYETCALDVPITVLSDGDKDGLSDEYENNNSCLDPDYYDSDQDHDRDGLSAIIEEQKGTDPCTADTDGDGLIDGLETNTYGSDPLVSDTDGDGLSDGFEAGVVVSAGSDSVLDSTPGDGDTAAHLAVWLGGDGQPATTAAPRDKQIIPVDGDAPRYFRTSIVAKDTDGDGVDDPEEIERGSDPTDPTLTPNAPFGPTGETRITWWDSDASFPSIAWSGSVFGVAWEDYREGDWEIYFTTLDGSGNKIGFEKRITFTGDHSISSDIVWTGSGFGLVWQDYREGSWQIYMSRLSPDGDTLGPETRVSSGAVRSLSPAITWSGSEYGIAWEDYRDGDWEIYFSTVDSSGTKTSGDTRISHQPGSSRFADISWSGSEFGIAWEGQEDTDTRTTIFFTRVGADGNEISDDVKAGGSEGSHSPAIAWTGSEYGVAFEDHRDGNWEIYFSRLTATGSIIGQETRISKSGAWSLYPDLAWSGSEFGAAWVEGGDSVTVEFAWISPFGAPTNSGWGPTPAPDWKMAPKVTFGDTHFGMVWEDFRDYNSEVYFASAGSGHDTDGDGLPDYAEAGSGWDYMNYDSDYDGLMDSEEDTNGNGIVDDGETDPADPDTDGDGVDDLAETLAGTDPLSEEQPSAAPSPASSSSSSSGGSSGGCNMGGDRAPASAYFIYALPVFLGVVIRLMRRRPVPAGAARTRRR